jgi:hypothetical protein
MATVSLIISIIALVCAYAAYTKSGGSAEEMKRKLEDLGRHTETLRNRVADILETVEKKVRKEEKKNGVPSEDKGPAQQNPQV